MSANCTERASPNVKVAIRMGDSSLPPFDLGREVTLITSIFCAFSVALEF